MAYIIAKVKKSFHPIEQETARRLSARSPGYKYFEA